METPASHLTLHRYRRTNQGFIENLGNGVTLTLMLIPEGEFLMGAAEDEPDSREEERPQHLVRVPKFLMGRYPITQAQWKIVTEMPQISRKLTFSPSGYFNASSYSESDKHPVEQVSWYEAVEFCQRLSVYTERNYGLPSEAEWEYACRAGTKTPFHFGEVITTEVANYRSTKIHNNISEEGSWQMTTTPVDHFSVANAFGLCDMHGNVLEWCQDHWHGDYKGATVDGTVWLTNSENSSRVIRGGSWDSSLKHCRSTSRDSVAPDTRNHHLGFRVVRRAPL